MSVQYLEERPDTISLHGAEIYTAAFKVSNNWMDSVEQGLLVTQMVPLSGSLGPANGVVFAEIQTETKVWEHEHRIIGENRREGGESGESDILKKLCYLKQKNVLFSTHSMILNIEKKVWKITYIISMFFKKINNLFLNESVAQI